AHHLDLHSFPTRRSSDLYSNHCGQSRTGSSDAALFAYHLVSQPVVLGTHGRKRNYETVYYAGQKLPFAQPPDAGPVLSACRAQRSEEHTSELQSLAYLVC